MSITYANEALKNVQHDFEVPVGEIGVTIRKGSKWADSIDMGNYEVDLWMCEVPHVGTCDPTDLGCVYKGTASLLGYWHGKLKNLPKSLLRLEHEVASRTMDGLRKSLVRAYGDDITDETLVTALLYLRTSIVDK